MATGKVIKVVYLDSYSVNGAEMHNFAVLFEGDKTAYMLSGKDKSKCKAEVGQDFEYSVVMKKDNPNEPQVFGKYINGNQVPCTKIKAVTANPFGNKGGGFKADPNQPHNILVTTCAQQAVSYIISRHTMDLIKDFDTVFHHILNIAEKELK